MPITPKARTYDKAWFNDRSITRLIIASTVYNLWSDKLCWENYIDMRNTTNNVYKEAEAKSNYI